MDESTKDAWQIYAEASVEALIDRYGAKLNKFPEDLYTEPKTNLKELLKDCGFVDMRIEYKFHEDSLLLEMQNYINNTYNQHYNKSKLQAFEEIVDAGYGLGFAMGNVTKYNKRYGKKAGRNRDDLLKMIHYSILALYVHDIEQGDNEEEQT